mmetsp:Transcript_9384/g.15824  ORF Transcript_9384/g.15824 Transcript_9384/m.15824 type:complete len:258 (-) Transcript_9384:96-869(-)
MGLGLLLKLSVPFHSLHLHLLVLVHYLRGELVSKEASSHLSESLRHYLGEKPLSSPYHGGVGFRVSLNSLWIYSLFFSSSTSSLQELLNHVKGDVDLVEDQDEAQYGHECLPVVVGYDVERNLQGDFVTVPLVLHVKRLLLLQLPEHLLQLLDLLNQLLLLLVILAHSLLGVVVVGLLLDHDLAVLQHDLLLLHLLLLLLLLLLLILQVYLDFKGETAVRSLLPNAWGIRWLFLLLTEGDFGVKTECGELVELLGLR